MQHLFAPYELAFKLREKGFDEPCLKSITETGFENNCSILGAENWNKLQSVVSIPMYQQVVDWFFEKHDIFICPIINIENKKWSWEIFKFDKASENGIGFNVLPENDWEHKGKNQALKEAIEEAIKLI